MEIPQKGYKRLLKPGEGVDIPKNFIRRAQRESGNSQATNGTLSSAVQKHRTDLQQQTKEECEQFEKDIRQLKLAHKIVVRRAESEVARGNKNDKDLNALVSYSEFLNFSSVREIIEDYAAPICDQVPGIKEELFKLKIGHNTLMEKDHMYTRKFAELNKKMQDFNEAKMLALSVKQTLTAEQDSIKETRYEMLDKIRQVDEKVRTLDRQNKQQRATNTRFDQQFFKHSHDIEDQHNQMIKKLDDFMRIQVEESGKLHKQSIDMAANFSTLEDRLHKLRDSVQQKISATMEKIVNRSDMHTAKMLEMKERMNTIANMLSKTEQNQNNIEDLQMKFAAFRSTQMAVVQSMPILNHFHICDAFSNIAPEKSQQVLNYSREKTKEIIKFLENRQDWTVQIEYMNTKLIQMLKVCYETGHGSPKFNYGTELSRPLNEWFEVKQDIDKRMKILRAELRDSFVAHQREEIAYDEAMKVCCEEGTAFNPVMLDHKVQMLKPHDIVRLFQETLSLRVKNFGKINEIVVEIPEDKNHYLYDIALRKKGIHVKDRKREGQIAIQQQQNTFAAPVVQNFPKNITVIPRDRIQPYQRLEKKFSNLFRKAHEEFQTFVQKQFENFSNTTQMTMSINSDIEDLKNVVNNIVDMVADAEHTLNKKIITVSDELEVTKDINGKKMDEEKDKVLKLITDVESLKGKQKELKSDLEQVLEKGQQLDAMVNALSVGASQQESLIRRSLLNQEAEMEKRLSKMKQDQIQFQEHVETIEAQKEKVILKKMSSMQASNALGSFQKKKTIRMDSKKDVQFTPDKIPSFEISKEGKILEREDSISSLEGSIDSDKKQKEPKKKLTATEARKKREAEIAQKIAEKKVKEEIAAKRRKERVAKEEKERKIKMEKEAEQQRLKDIEARRNAIDEEIKGKVVRRQTITNDLRRGSKTVSLGNKFLNNLNTQKEAAIMGKLATVVNEKMSGRRDKESNEKTGKGGSNILSKPFFETKKTNKDIMVTVTSEEDDEETDEDDYVNPFTQIKELSKLIKKKDMDEEKVQEIIKPQLDALEERLKTLSDQDIMPKHEALETKVKEISTEIKTYDSRITNVVDESLKVKGQTLAEINKLQFELEHGLKTIQEQLEVDTRQRGDFRQKIRQDVTESLETVHKQSDQFNYEMERMNLLVKGVHNVQTHMIQDQILGQLLVEGDCLDRKQLALFGIKPNRDQVSNSPSKKVGEGTSFAQRFMDHEYEAVKVDKNCGACRNGELGTILSQIKLACLQYQSSPISYDAGAGEKLELNVPDIILVKEKLLKQTQSLISKVDEDMARLPSQIADNDPVQSEEKFGLGIEGPPETKSSQTLDNYRRRLFSDPRHANQRYDVKALNHIVELDRNRRLQHSLAIDDAIGWSITRHDRKSQSNIETKSVSKAKGARAVYSSLTIDNHNFSTIDPAPIKANLRNASALSGECEETEEMPLIDARVTIKNHRRSGQRLVAKSTTFERSGNNLPSTKRSDKLTNALQMSYQMVHRPRQKPGFFSPMSATGTNSRQGVPSKTAQTTKHSQATRNVVTSLSDAILKINGNSVEEMESPSQSPRINAKGGLDSRGFRPQTVAAVNKPGLSKPRRNIKIPGAYL